MSDIDHALHRAERFCQENGIRLTAKRKQVLLGLLEKRKALSAYQLIDICKEDSETAIPAMTVYRILKFLEENHLVHRLELANKYVACRHFDCSHPLNRDHEASQFLICKVCDKVNELSIDKSIVEELAKNVEDSGFDLLSQQLEMSCICKDCATSAA